MKFPEFAVNTAWRSCRPGWYVAWTAASQSYRSQTFGLHQQAEAFARELEEGRPHLMPRVMSEEKGGAE